MEHYIKNLEARFLIIAILAVFGMVLHGLQVLNLSSFGLWAIAGVYLLYSAGLWVLVKRSLFDLVDKHGWMLWTAQFLDIVFLTGILYFLGTYETFVGIFLYYLTILNTFSPRRFDTLTLLKANFSMVCFGALILLEAFGILAHQTIGLTELSLSQQLALLGFGVISINACAIIKISSETRLRRQAEWVQSVNESLEEKVRLQTQDLREANAQITKQLAELTTTHRGLVQSEKLASLGTMIGGLYHEIFNPLHQMTLGLAAIKKYTQYLVEVGEQCKRKIGDEPWQQITNLEDGRNWAKTKERLEALFTQTSLSSHRIIQLIRDVRNFSRTDDDEWTRVNVSEVVQTVVHILSPLIEDKEARLELKLPEGCIVRGLQGPLNQVFMNVLKNALDAIPRQGKISLAAENEGPVVYVRIKDNGCGIRTEDLGKVFDPFFTRKARNEGTGLGLSISHRVIDSHQGEIKINSAYGKGTTVHIRLPH